MDKNTKNQPPVGQALLAAAMLLPGVSVVHAETPPERGAVSVKYLYYKEDQPGLDRIQVRTPSIAVLAPIAGEWSIAASATTDDVSGATPRYHTAVSGASRMDDRRKAGDVSVTRYFSRGTLSVGAAYSTENDFRSRALSLQGTYSSEDKNTTWALGVGGADDAINPVNLLVVGETRQTINFLAGVTRVLTPRDIAQLTFTYSKGHGYYSDPYKLLDERPRHRDQSTALAQWNHRFVEYGGTSRLSYRFYHDSYGIDAHTIGAEYVQSLSHGWTVSPSLRFYSQSKANFYFDPVYDPKFGPPFPPGYVFGQSGLISADQRLSAFGAITVGFKVAKQIDRDWSVDLKLERYEQRGSWRWFGSGSPGLDPLRAMSVQVGVTRLW